MPIGLIVHTLIYNEKKEILIIKRASHRNVLPNQWDIPGGTLEEGEDPVYGAIREIKEETNLNFQTTELSLFSYTHTVDQEKNKQFVRLIFIAQYQGGEIQVDPKEHEDFLWIPMNKLNDYPVVDYIPGLFDLLYNHKHRILNF